MLFRINFVALLSLSVTLITHAKKVDECENDRRLDSQNMWSGKGSINESRELRIVGGETAEKGQFPYYGKNQFQAREREITFSFPSLTNTRFFGSFVLPPQPGSFVLAAPSCVAVP